MNGTTTPRSALRTFAALLAAVAATPLAIAAVMAIADAAGLFGDNGGLIGTVVVFSLYATPIALVMTVIAGWPLARAAIRRGRTRVRDFTILGAALGALPFVGYFAYVLGFDAWHLAVGSSSRSGREVASGWLLDSPEVLAWIALGATCGIASALAFWVVAVRGTAVAPKAST